MSAGGSARAHSQAAYEVFRSEESGCSLTFSGGALKSRERTSEEGYGVRVLKGGRLGFSYCEKKEDIGAARERAASLSRYSPRTGFSFPPRARYPRMRLSDRAVESLEAEEMKGLLGQMRDGVERHAKKSRVILSAGTEAVWIDNSEGFSGAFSSTSVSAYVEGMSGDGFGFAYEEGLSMPRDFTGIGERAGRMAKGMRGAKKPESGEHTVIFTLSALEDLLYVLFPSFSGEWKRKGTSVLGSLLGRRVFSSALSIYDDPLSPASDARPFDDEGTVSRRIPLVEGGILKEFIYDRETAALEGVGKGGFCSRPHFSSPPGASRSNTVIKGGDYADLEEELGSFIIVHSLHGSHTANTTTGDFGLEVNVAFQKKRGRTAPVRGFLLSGNVFKLLKGNIYLERKAQMLGSIIAPRMAFDGIRVVS